MSLVFLLRWGTLLTLAGRLANTVTTEPSSYMQTLTRYLSNIMNSTLLGLPREIKELIYFDALSHAANKILVGLSRKHTSSMLVRLTNACTGPSSICRCEAYQRSWCFCARSRRAIFDRICQQSREWPDVEGESGRASANCQSDAVGQSRGVFRHFHPQQEVRTG